MPDDKVLLFFQCAAVMLAAAAVVLVGAISSYLLQCLIDWLCARRKKGGPHA